MTIVKNRIKRIRLSRGLTERELADKSGVSKSQIGRIENNEQSPTLDTLHMIAKALNVSILDLIEGE